MLTPRERRIRVTYILPTSKRVWSRKGCVATPGRGRAREGGHRGEGPDGAWPGAGTGVTPLTTKHDPKEKKALLPPAWRPEF